MAEGRLKAALLVISTTAAKDPSTDASQLALSDVLEKEGGGKWELVETKIVSDVVTQIQRQIMLWADVPAEGINLIVTTGGTGFATADNTPEVRFKPCFDLISVLLLHAHNKCLLGCLGSTTQAGPWPRSRHAGCFTPSHTL